MNPKKFVTIRDRVKILGFDSKKNPKNENRH